MFTIARTATLVYYILTSEQPAASTWCVARRSSRLGPQGEAFTR